MGPKFWDLVPKDMKQVTILNEFKAKTKILKLENCLYRLSRTYPPQIGFITQWLMSMAMTQHRLMSFDEERGVLSATIPVLLWYVSALNQHWEKAEQFD